MKRTKFPGFLVMAGLPLAATAQPVPTTEAATAPEVRVTASPLPVEDLDAMRPASVVGGTELDRRRAPGLADSLTHLPGVQSSGFGPAAARPVLRGFDGPRVGITQDGLDTLDASSLSPDHAVSADPLAARRIEVLRGPATLLYGGGAIGGLVNVVEERIPRTRLSGVSGGVDASLDSASRGRAGSVSLRGGARGLNWTANAFGRDAEDYRIPGAAVQGDPNSARGRLPGSFNRAEGGSLGLSWVGERVTVGVGGSTLDNRYGIPGEAALIDLSRRRTEWLLEVDRPLPGFENLRIRRADNRYVHREIETDTGEVGTTFRNRGDDTRIELKHAPLAGVSGVVGAQLRDRRFSALGEEAYVPPVREQADALFWVGERRAGPLRLEAGVRHEVARLDPAADTGLASRRFGLNSASVGATLPLPFGRGTDGAAGPWSAGLLLSSSERAPALEELYANGPHAATRTFERGDAALGRERSVNLEASLRHRSPTLDARLGVYANRFRDYIYGRLVDANGDGIADRVDADYVFDAADPAAGIANSAADPGAGEFRRVDYAQTRARFRGLEAELRWRPTGQPWSLRVFADMARGTLQDAGAVPRMAPMRAGATVDWQRGAWSGFLSWLSVRRQGRLAALETTTPGYDRVDAEVAYTIRATKDATLALFVQGRNLLNEEIRLHTSFVKDVAPQPGRSVLTGVRARF